MRLYILCAALLFVAACGNTDSSSKSTDAPAAEAKEEAAMGEETTGPIDPKTKKDPVCGMDWDAEWTEHSVYNGDTIRFCSEGCKMAFDARPAKYVTVK